MINLLTAENIIDHYPFVRLMGGFKAARAIGHTVSIMKLSCDDSSICITGKAADFRLQACHMMAGFFSSARSGESGFISMGGRSPVMV